MILAFASWSSGIFTIHPGLFIRAMTWPKGLVHVSESPTRRSSRPRRVRVRSPGSAGQRCSSHGSDQSRRIVSAAPRREAISDDDGAVREIEPRPIRSKLRNPLRGHVKCNKLPRGARCAR